MHVKMPFVNDQKNLITLQNVTFSYYPGHPVCQGINLHVAAGKITAIMGPSGMGKTTLLKLMAGQLFPQQGKVLFKHYNIPTLPRNQLFTLRKKLGMLFQSGALFTDLTLFDNVAFPLREHTQLSEQLIRITVLMKLEAVGLRGAGHLMPAELSGGMARRVGLARAAALDPELVLLDEPFVGQDPVSLGMLVKCITTFNHALGITFVIVSHDIHTLLNIADYSYIFAEHQIIAQGSSAALRTSYDPSVCQFLKGIADGPLSFHYPAKEYAMELFSPC